MANELIYQQGGTLVLDEVFEYQPSAATITITTMSGGDLDDLHSTFTNIEDAACTVDDLELTLAATNKSARVFTPSATSGTIGDLTADGYRMLLNRGGRRHWFNVSEFDSSGGNVTSFRVDEGIDFAISAGDKAYGLRVSYDVDWSAVTSDFTGQIKALWKVTVNGVVQKILRVYDVVRQTLTRQASWADVVARRPDVDPQMSEIRDKEQLVKVAWDDVVSSLYNMGIRHNLVVPNNSTILRDITVMQTLINLTLHQSLPVPNAYMGRGEQYIQDLEDQKARIMGGFLLPVDDNEDGILDAGEEGRNRRAVWLRGRRGHRQVQ